MLAIAETPNNLGGGLADRVEAIGSSHHSLMALRSAGAILCSISSTIRWQTMSISNVEPPNFIAASSSLT